MRSSADAIVARLLQDVRPLEIVGRLQPYAWGGTAYLRELTGLPLGDGLPAAEWWLGAHPSAPSTVMLEGQRYGLDALLEAAPERLLGRSTADRFGARLPYLVKVLDVRQMLSIQAHPSKRQAEAGFARENAAGAAADAPTRNYRDDNHKPEAQVALTPFWMLVGFRPLDDLRRVLGERAELRPLAARLDAARGSLAALYEQIVTLSDADAEHMIGGLARRLTPDYRAGRLARDVPDFWAARAIEQFRDSGGGYDRGVLAIYCMNLVELAPGEATFLGAGLIHAYLEGRCVEVMANSDNVIRGGLTPKHVDVEELQRVVTFEPSQPTVMAAPRGPGEHRYRLPAGEFGLSQIRLGADPIRFETGAAPEILTIMEGEARLDWSSGNMTLARGRAVFLPAGVTSTATSIDGALLFRAFVPPA